MLGALEQDVFVSYAHADNGIAQGASSSVGWVSALAANLNEGPNVYKKRIFIDHKLSPGDEFSDELLEKVARSRLLVLLLSQNYVESKWCGRELEHFIDTHASDPEKPVGVYVVELVPYENLTAVPSIIQTVRKRLIHAKFWYQPVDKKAFALSGYPSPKDLGPEASSHYWNALNELRAAIDARLRALVSDGPADAPPEIPDPAGSEAGAATAIKPLLGTVLLADATEDLEADRLAIKLALEPEGIVVLPDGDYVGLSPPEFDAAIAADLARCDLFVQLLSPTVGRRGKGFDTPLPQLQFHRALAAGRPIMQWCERQPVDGQIREAAHASLFQTEFLRVTHRVAFEQEIVERLRAEKAKREQALAAPQPAAPASPPRSRRKVIFVDDLASDPALTGRLRNIMREQDCDVRSLPANAPLGNNGIDIKELLRPCRAGITIFADRSKYLPVYSRLVYFLNHLAEHDLQVERWGVYLEQGTVAGTFGIDSNDVVAIDERGLGDFLRGL